MLVWQTLVATPVIRRIFSGRPPGPSACGCTRSTALALVGDDRVSSMAHQRRAVSQLSQLVGDFIGDELAVGENLEVAIGMTGPGISNNSGCMKRLAPEDAEEAVCRVF